MTYLFRPYKTNEYNCLKNVIGAAVYSTITTGGKIRKIAGYTDLQSVYVHIITLDNSRQKDFNRRWFSPPDAF